MLAPDVIWEEHEALKDDSYVPKDGSIQVVRVTQLKILFVVKVGTMEQFTWSTPSLGGVTSKNCSNNAR